MRPVFADPKTDLVFKRTFGDEAHKDLLIELLNSLLQLDQARRIVDLSYLTPEQAPQIRALKNSLVDVKCLDAQGVRYIVEMQLLHVEGFEKRVVYNLCKAFSSQLGVGEDYPLLGDVVALTICDFLLWPNQKAPEIPMLSRWSMCEEQQGARRLQQIRCAMLELPKYQAGDDPITPVDKWAYFFRETAHLRSVPRALAEAPYARALEQARVSRFTPDEWELYDREKMAEQDARGALSHALHVGRADGFSDGRAQGFSDGLAAGRVEGLLLAVEDLCELLAIPLTPERRASLKLRDEAGLVALRERLRRLRRWDE